MSDLVHEIARLKRDRRAIILSHTYQPPEIQTVADYVGDSYGLSRRAADVEADMIVFCGVRFMAETAAVLNPDRRVVLPDLTAGCPMADTITPAQLRKLQEEYPAAATVSYVNTTAAVKAESTICCTSSNAVRIVNSLGDSRDEVIFVPDRYLGLFVARQTSRKLVLWEGACPVHTALAYEAVGELKAEHPQAEVIVHPECLPEVQATADHVLSTGQMCELVKHTSCREFIVGTERGILHTLRRIAPGSVFHHACPGLVCPDMKRITLEKVRSSLEDGEPRVTVPGDVAARARRAIEAMIAVTDGVSLQPA